MVFPRFQELPPADNGPNHNELVSEIFAETTRQKFTLIELSARTGIALSKIKRIKSHQYPPSLPEFIALCKAVNRSYVQIDEAARFHRTLADDTAAVGQTKTAPVGAGAKPQI